MIPTMVVVAATVLLLGWIAVEDLRHARIRNQAVLGLIALWVALAALEGFTHIIDSLIAGALLLVIGFIAWTLRVVGAGDAKLLFACGLLLGLTVLLPFSIFMVAATLLFVLLLAGARMIPFYLPPAMAVRLDTMVSTRKIPAAVPIAVALALSLPIRYGLI